MSGQRRTLGRYELLELIGRGATTDAHRAKSFGVEGFEKILVVKRVVPELSASGDFLPTFLEHVQRAMRLSHANLAQVFDLGRVEDLQGVSYYFATEHVAGLDVATIVQRCRTQGSPLPLSACITLALEVAKALDHAHRRKDEQSRPLGLLHGAVAPHNVLVSFDGDVKLTDFGVTRAVLSIPRPRESLRRTYAAMSPEQAAGEEPTVASDVFSLGSFLYFAITGVPTFPGATAAETLQTAARGEITPVEQLRPDVPGPLAELVGRALARDPEERFSSVSLLHEELLACTYACGLRRSTGELVTLVDQHREPPATVPTESVEALLSRPLTVPPPAAAPPEEPSVVEPPPAEREPDRAVAAPPVTGSEEPGPVRSLSVPPLTQFGEMRHVTSLVLSLRQTGPLPIALRDWMHAVFDRYGGSILTEEEHELTALFGLDRSDGRDTEVAVRCGLVLVRGLDVDDVAPSAGIDAGRIRVGIDRRAAIDPRTERLVAGSRMLSAGAERTVTVSRRGAATLGGRFPLEPLGAAFRVTEFAQDSFSDAFVGRRAELQHLGEALVRAARGELRLLGIVGEPGVGKTRLAVEMQRRLSRGSVDLQTYFATCPPRGRELPLSGLVVMLRRVCGVRDGDPAARIDALEPRLRALGLDTDEVNAVLAELRAAAPNRFRGAPALRSAVMRMMHSLAEDRFTVFIWDDAHELDAASCDLLTKTTTRLVGSRIAVVLSGRPDAGAPYLAMEMHSELRLAEMDATDVERLVTQRIGVDQVPSSLLSFLGDRAGGQPMFVEQLLRELSDAGMLVVENGRITSLSLDEGVNVPRTLRALTSERLRRLSDDERHLFVAAAVLEPPVSVALLSRMLGLGESVVDSIAEPLVGRSLLGRDGPTAFTFPSPLAREVVLAELDGQDLAVLHRTAADAYISLLGPRLDRDADRVAYHVAAAGDADGAADLYARGGVYALGRRQLDRAVLDLAYALDLTDLETRSASQLGNWLGALSTAVRYVRTGPGLQAIIERSIRRLENEKVDLVLRARMRIDLAGILGALDQQLAAEALLDSGADEAPANPEIVSAYLAMHAELASGRGEYRLARRALDPLAKVGVTDRGEIHRITLSMARTLGAAGKLEAAYAALEDAENLAARDDPLLSLERASVRTTLFGHAQKWREAAEASVQAAAQAEELGLLYEVASSLSEQAVALARSGDLARARAAVASAVAAAEETEAERVLCRCRLLLGYLESGDQGRTSLDLQREHIAVVESHGWIADALLGRYLLGRMAARLGVLDEARHELSLASRIATSTGNQSYADQFAAELSRF